jgi:hypothetical protein
MVVRPCLIPWNLLFSRCFFLCAPFGSRLLIGAWFRKRMRSFNAENRGDFIFVLGGALTLLGLIMGFTFSMAVSRYDQRKNYEEQKANAIATAYIRADLLPVADAAKMRKLLKSYLDQRIYNYNLRDGRQLRQSDAETTRLQTGMWSAVAAPAAAQPSALTVLTVAGMNEVLSAQGYTQAAWRNRIPRAAWALAAAISIFCDLMIGYIAQGKSGFVLLILPIVLSISLFLIADIDSPRGGGVIHVPSQNLANLAESLRSQ